MGRSISIIVVFLADLALSFASFLWDFSGRKDEVGGGLAARGGAIGRAGKLSTGVEGTSTILAESEVEGRGNCCSSSSRCTAIERRGSIVGVIPTRLRRERVSCSVQGPGSDGWPVKACADDLLDLLNWGVYSLMPVGVYEATRWPGRALEGFPTNVPGGDLGRCGVATVFLGGGGRLAAAACKDRFKDSGS